MSEPHSRPERYRPVDEAEAALLGGAVLATLRGDELTTPQADALRRAGTPTERASAPVLDSSETWLTLPRGRGAEIRVRWRRYKGSSPFLDLRRWQMDGTGAMQPTRQGVVIRMRELPKLLQVVVQLARRD